MKLKIRDLLPFLVYPLFSVSYLDVSPYYYYYYIYIYKKWLSFLSSAQPYFVLCLEQDWYYFKMKLSLFILQHKSHRQLMSPQPLNILSMPHTIISPSNKFLFWVVKSALFCQWPVFPQYWKNDGWFLFHE